jgi:hypothetical protein
VSVRRIAIEQSSTQPCVDGARPKHVRYPAGSIVAPILLLAAAAVGCATPTTGTTSSTTPASATTACPGEVFVGAGQPSSAFPVSPATEVIASAAPTVAAPPPSRTTPTIPISVTCPPEASTVASPTPAVTIIQTSPTPPPSASPGTASPIPTAPNVAPTATVSAGHTLTFADNGAAVLLTVGQHLDLILPPDGLGAWDRPIIDGTGLAITAVSGGYPSSTPLHATFTARTAGDATIRTGTDLACFHTTPKCLPPVMLWSVTVHVTSAAETSALALCQTQFATVLAADMWTVRAARGPFGPHPSTPLPDPFATYIPDQAVALCLLPGAAGGLERVVALVPADRKVIPMWTQNGDTIMPPS